MPSAVGPALDLLAGLVVDDPLAGLPATAIKPRIQQLSRVVPPAPETFLQAVVEGPLLEKAATLAVPDPPAVQLARRSVRPPGCPG